jgi:dTDP-glucose 4,6-dehydratase
MKHIIIGGDGFVGRHLAHDLVERGEEVVVTDVVQSRLDVYAKAKFIRSDITDPAAVDALPFKADDVVYNLSAKMLSPIQIRAKRHEFFWPVNYHGAENVMRTMQRRGANRLVQFTTDMVYGHTLTSPQTEDTPTEPLGEYGLSKLAVEKRARDFRAEGIRISIFRPRLIIGPGRLGILEKLFKAIDRHLPVPMIGGGRNPYQFISVFDCASACVRAWEAGFPNAEYNLGSDNPPPVRKLLKRLIKEAGSRSFLLPTPAPLVKLTLNFFDRINRPIMDPEQYLIADEECILDTTKAKRELGWNPRFDDTTMLLAAYREYRAGLAAKRGRSPSHSIQPAE